MEGSRDPRSQVGVGVGVGVGVRRSKAVGCGIVDVAGLTKTT
jgi:hypothetical protein